MGKGIQTVQVCKINMKESQVDERWLPDLKSIDEIVYPEGEAESMPAWEWSHNDTTITVEDNGKSYTCKAFFKGNEVASAFTTKKDCTPPEAMYSFCAQVFPGISLENMKNLVTSKKALKAEAACNATKDFGFDRAINKIGNKHEQTCRVCGCTQERACPKKLAEIDCGWFHFVGRGWVRCDALDWMYCLYSKKPCSFWKPAKERNNRNVSSKKSATVIY
jgi:hypothetical protein